jgi:RecB family exonuclease
VTTADESWNPAQRAVVELLGRGAGRVDIPEGLADELRAELDAAIAEVADLLSPDDPLFVSKHALSTVFRCEAQHLAGQGRFEWSPPVARGTVAHKAIELGANSRREHPPAELVDEAIARLIDSDAQISRYLEALGDLDLAEVRGPAVNLVTRFVECFPPLRPAWFPRTESRLAYEAGGGRVKLSGKVDLSLGRGADKVIIDLKTGWANADHRADLRFYALVELLASGTAPRKLASYYLDEASAHPEDVTEGVLRTAARRTADGIVRMARLHRGGDEPTRTAGSQCRWCELSESCDVGRRYLDEADDTLD